MTVINGKTLLDKLPLIPMYNEKRRDGPGGVSYGLTEAGYDVRIEQHIELNKFKRFTLASTIEQFDMPDDFVAVVHDKSTWARQGLSVFNTVIEPGWRGFLTLELVYHGDKGITIPKGSGIAQVIFHRIAEPGSYGNGKYQNQERGPVQARFE